MHWTFDARVAAGCAALLCIAATAQATAQVDFGRPRAVTQIAEGVYVIQHRDAPFEGGNSTVIIGEEAVLVFDPPQLPYAAREDIEAIRGLTDKPVRYVVNSHWHGDHNMGNDAYVRAFPGVTIIAQAETAKDMDLNNPRIPTRAAQAVRDAVTRTESLLAGDTASDGSALSAADRAGYQELLARRRQVVDDYANLVYHSPTLTFERALDVNLGNRRLQLRHLGRGNTNGDIVGYLPAERIAMSGDLLVHPLPFLLDGYPSEWVVTLERLSKYDAAIIVPGHGAIMRDFSYLHLLREFMTSAIDQMNARFHIIGPAEFQTLENVVDHVDMSAFRGRFNASPEDFDAVAERLVQLVFKEAALR